MRTIVPLPSLILSPLSIKSPPNKTGEFEHFNLPFIIRLPLTIILISDSETFRHARDSIVRFPFISTTVFCLIFISDPDLIVAFPLICVTFY